MFYKNQYAFYQYLISQVFRDIKTINFTNHSFTTVQLCILASQITKVLLWESFIFIFCKKVNAPSKNFYYRSKLKYSKITIEILVHRNKDLATLTRNFIYLAKYFYRFMFQIQIFQQLGLCTTFFRNRCLELFSSIKCFRAHLR